MTILATLGHGMRRAGKFKLVSERTGKKPSRPGISNPTIGTAMVIAAAVGFYAYDPALLANLGGTTVSQPKLLVGRATVIDGDTVEIKGEHVRLNGIDAPESRQSCKDAKGKIYRCGAVAAGALDGFLAASRPLRCEFITRDRYGRFVGNCFRTDGKSVAAWLVRDSHALDWPRYSQGDYADEQASAKAEKTGLWAGTFEAPWDWRAEDRSKQAAEDKPSTTQPLGLVASAGCRIKGNINGEGERIYHLPGQKFYANMRITPARGERWFCSEAEAKAAGWRRAS